MSCPSSEELAALYDCVLPRVRAELVRAHLAECPRCANDIRVLGNLLACPDPPVGPPPAVIEQAKHLTNSSRAANAEEPRPSGARPDPARNQSRLHGK